MKKLVEIKRGDWVPNTAKLIKTESKTTMERPARGGDMVSVSWDLYEVYEENIEKTER